VPATIERASTRDAIAADEVDAQLSELLQSVEADRARPLTERSGTPAAVPPTRPVPVVPTRPGRRARKPAAKRERARGERRTAARARAGPGFARKAEAATIPYVRDPALRETAYYVIAAVVLAAAVGLLGTRLFA
jgi:hypothetical protein